MHILNSWQHKEICLSEIKNEITRIFGHLKLHDVILTLILAGVASLVAKAFFGA